MAIALVTVVVALIGTVVWVAVRRHQRMNEARARARIATVERRSTRPSIYLPRENGGVPGVLAGLSAVEALGRFTVVAAVAVVEAGDEAEGVPKPAREAEPPGPEVVDGPPTSDRAVKDQRRATCRLRATCQIVRVERQASGTLVDLVTLEPCRLGDRRVPPGTALALGFRPGPTADGAGQLATTAGRWEADGAVINMAVNDTSQGTRYRFTCPDDRMALLVDAERV